MHITSLLAFLALWTVLSLFVFRMQRQALAAMRASDRIPFTARSVLFSCALLGLVLALGTTVLGTFLWHKFLA